MMLKRPSAVQPWPSANAAVPIVRAAAVAPISLVNLVILVSLMVQIVFSFSMGAPILANQETPCIRLQSNGHLNHKARKKWGYL
jgi:hypothetical protein